LTICTGAWVATPTIRWRCCSRRPWRSGGTRPG
jgi:hypothetical protein